MSDSDLLTLSAAGLDVEITGGDLLSVSSMRWRDTELLLAPEELGVEYRIHGLRAGITLLHPWANRLSSDAYSVEGVAAALPDAGTRVSRDANGLAIHGLLAPTNWRLERTDARTGRATLDWAGETAFPFPHQVGVTFTLTGDEQRAELELATTVRAVGTDPVPVALGWHPYFRAERESARLELPAMTALAADSRGIPTGSRSHFPAQREALGHRAWDDGFADLAPGAHMTLELPDRRICVEFGRGYADGQVFAPLDAPNVSLEPMTAPTNALLGSDAALVMARPGALFEADFSVSVESPAEA